MRYGLNRTPRRGKAAAEVTGTSLVLAAALWLFAVPAAAQDTGDMMISQVDSSALLLRGTIDIFVPRDAFDVLPGADEVSVRDRDGGELQVLSVRAGALRDEGISFLLMLDNSGSMYDETYGGRRRIDEAADAVAEFTAAAGGGPDRLGLALFNTRLTVPAPVGSSSDAIIGELEGLIRPAREEAYTELYLAAIDALGEISAVPGRRALVLLSDGRNLSYADYEGAPNPSWGDERSNADEVIEACLRSGVTLYGIYFADERDPDLARMAAATGGEVYEARSAGDLSEVYRNIRDDILSELRIRVRAPAIARSQREIQVSANGREAFREYYVPMVFGAAAGVGQTPWILPLIIAAAVLAAAAGLFAIPLESPAAAPQLSSLDTGATVILGSGATTVGSAREAGFTLAGRTGVEAEHATVIREDDGSFTVVAGGKLRVNNRPVTRAKLEAGDVIRMEGATVIFDAPQSGGTQEVRRPGKGQADKSR
jgi:Ca-activated chloride channel family protein